MSFTFYRLNLGNNYAALIVLSNESQTICWIDGPIKRPLGRTWFPVGWQR